MSERYIFTITDAQLLDGRKGTEKLALTYGQMMRLLSDLSSKAQEIALRVGADEKPAPSPGYVDCEIFNDKGVVVVRLPGRSGGVPIDWSPREPSFMGYVIDGAPSATSIMFRGNELVRATAVRFAKGG